LNHLHSVCVLAWQESGAPGEQVDLGPKSGKGLGHFTEKGVEG